jgi:NhaP-type Na+/H+ or K+/H+ antiporter
MIRMLPVAVSLIGLGLRPATIGFLGWFGPRGLASIILALVVVEDAPALQGIEQIFVVMTVTVLLSVFAHGMTAAPFSRRYARAGDTARAGEPEHEPVVEIPTLAPGTCTRSQRVSRRGAPNTSDEVAAGL